MSQSERQTGNSPPHPPDRSSAGLLVWGGVMLWIPGVWAILGLMLHWDRNAPGAGGPYGDGGVVGALVRIVVLVGSYVISSIIALALPAIYLGADGSERYRAVVCFPALFNLGELACVIIVNTMTKS